eukprot:m51a1_g2824 hypothetical protein (992) ;mRNA; f:189925-194680
MCRQVWASIVLSLLLALPANTSAAGCAHTEPQATRSHLGFTSSSASTVGVSSRAGLEAALREASDVSRLQFVPVWLDDHFSDAVSANNTRRLVCELGAFVFAASVGSSASELALEQLRLLEGPTGTPVPFFGPFSSSAALRHAQVVTGADGRVGVINVRAGGDDEVVAVVSFLSRDYEQLRRTAIVTGGNSYGAYVRTFLNGTLAVAGVQPWAVVDDVPYTVPSGERAALAKKIVDRLLCVPRHMAGDAIGRPLAVVLATTGIMTAPIIAEMAERGVANVTFVCSSNIEPRYVHGLLSDVARARLKSLSSQIFFEQLVQPSSTDSELAQAFVNAMNESGHDTRDANAFEGYIVGRLIATVATRALEIYGWPLTRQTFLDTVFRSYRKFALHDVKFGPYGDGVAPQLAEDWCNQGSHEVFTSQLNIDTGALVPQPSSTFKFAGDLEGMRLGLSSALIATNSARTASDHVTFAAATRGTSTADAVQRLLAADVLAIAGLQRDAVTEALRVLRAQNSDVPLIAPLSGSSQLRFPFRSNRNVINLVPLTQQELLVAVQYILATTASTASPSTTSTLNKKEVSKGDLATIKEEIGLLHKLHHPNLLMLMGYCETRNELLVVSEYMSGGSLKEYLARNRGQLGVFSLIAMAFDVVKGIAYLHASKPPIVHGSISTRSLLVDYKLTTKQAGDLSAALALTPAWAFVGPESFALSPLDGRTYAGLLDGRIVRFDPANAAAAETFVSTGRNCTSIFREARQGAEEAGCGRPLGLAFGEDGVLWVADAWAGILNVFPNRTIVSVLSSIDGERLRFANGIAVDHRTGVVIVRYDPRDGSTRVLAQDLPCPNGVALTPSSEALVVAFTAQMSLARLWVSGPRAGKLEAPLGGAALPGFLDNVALSPRGTFWAGASRPAKPLILAVIRRPAVRRLLALLPIGLIQAVVKDHAMLWEVTEDGDVVRVLEDASGSVVGNAGALEYEDGSLLLESFCSPTLRLLKRA